MKKLLILSLNVSLMLCTACASIVSKNDCPVSFTSTPSGANIIVSDSSGRTIHHGKTPSTVTLEANEGYFDPAEYSVQVRKRGFESKNQTLKAEVDGWYWGNILLGGLIGMVFVDPATGAMYELDDNMHIYLEDNRNACLMKDDVGLA